ncbi:MAG: FAD:protein FMN transferase, partial [Planctomycetes bacterium]|nr:FAD:protein FMN transferase [Planctomycetota bacterium]
MNRRQLRSVLYIGLAALLLLAAAQVCLRRPPAAPLQVRQTEKGRYEARFSAMGTDGALTIYAGDGETAARAARQALAQVKMVERRMSTYRPDSEISRLNAHGAASPVKLSEATLATLRRAKEVSKLTGGAFDVTYAPLGALWRRAEERGKAPSAEQISQALSSVGWDKLVFEGG